MMPPFAFVSRYDPKEARESTYMTIGPNKIFSHGDEGRVSCFSKSFFFVLPYCHIVHLPLKEYYSIKIIENCYLVKFAFTKTVSDVV